MPAVHTPSPPEGMHENLLQNASLPRDVEQGAAPASSTLVSESCDLRCNVSFDINGTPILQNVAAHFRSGKCTALMGPSGAGKTSLLNVLCGRASYGEVSGEVTANNVPLEPAVFKQKLTYVPQNDVLWSALTVRQLLLYTAELRLALPEAERESRVDDVIKQLGLSERADVVVGDDLNPSLSGGQKKRVSIAMELLADRPVLFVDEPTSGLDSVTSAEVVELLCSLAARLNKTVICTIHQPTWDMLQHFHALLVLAKGTVVYNGQVAGLVQYMNSCDAKVKCPAYVNPIDFFFELISAPGGAFKWHDHYTDAMGMGSSPQTPLRASMDKDSDYPISKLSQAIILFRRAAWLLLKDPSRGMALLMPQIFMGLVTGLSFWQIGYGSADRPDTTIANLVFMLINLAFMPNLMFTVVTIPLEKAIVLREYRNGTYSLVSFWMGRVLLSILTALFVNIIAVPIPYFMVGLPCDIAKFFAFYLVISGMSIVAQLLSLVIGCSVANAEAAVQKVPPLIIVFMLYAGLLIPKDNIHPWFIWIYYINPFNYTYKLLMYIGCNGQSNGAGDALLKYFSVDEGDVLPSALVLSGLVLSLSFVGYFLSKRSFLTAK